MRISNENLVEVIADANYVTDTGATVERTIVSSLFPLGRDVVNVIQGVRRCGKSTLLRQMAKQFGREKHNRCVFVNFEDPRLSEFLNHELLEQIIHIYPVIESAPDTYFFFDEIQNVLNWEKWIHIQLERKMPRQFIVTSSNATLLGGKLGTSLTGRHVTTEVFPLSLPEFLKLLPEKKIEDFLKIGGFPRAIQYPNPEILLREYFTDIIHRDVRNKVMARSEKPIVQIAKAIFESAGSELSLRKLATAFDVSIESVKQYIDACQDAYLIQPCGYFSFSEKQRAVRANKYYPIDLGLRKAVCTRTGLDIGKQFETSVFHALRRDFREVFYWRGCKEVDFIVETRNGWQPIQVTADQPQKRQSEALTEFALMHPHALPGIIVTLQTGVEILDASRQFLNQ